MSQPIPESLASIVGELFLPERLPELRVQEPPILSVVSGYEKRDNRRFEGFYGRLYTRVIQTPVLRRAAFSLWGSADPLYEFEAFVADAIAAARAASGAPLVVDLPSGSGTLLPFLAEQEFAGKVVAIDLAMSMLRRAVMVERSQAASFQTVFVQSDALDLPLRDSVADVVVSVNGLHVLSDPQRFLAETARILKPSGKLWLITPVTAKDVRSRLILAAAKVLAITPSDPPTLPVLHRLLNDAGFRVLRSYGGTSITGLACTRSTG